MKKYIFIVIILTSIIKSYSQFDIIYPSNNIHVIHDCSITEIRYGNSVYYTKDSVSDIIAADSIQIYGETIVLASSAIDGNIDTSFYNSGLYKGHDYEYYKQTYIKAKYNRNTGIFLTLLGVSSSIVGILIYPVDGFSRVTPNTANFLFYGGSVMADVGVIFWISGAIKAANNKSAMSKTKKSTSLSFRTTNNGLGMVFNF